MGLFGGGKHSSGETSSGKDYNGKHRAKGTENKTVDIRVDTDENGRVTGWGVGRGAGPGDEHYDR